MSPADVLLSRDRVIQNSGHLPSERPISDRSMLDFLVATFVFTHLAGVRLGKNSHYSGCSGIFRVCWWPAVATS
jgi:hypothetical protein